MNDSGHIRYAHLSFIYFLTTLTKLPATNKEDNHSRCLMSDPDPYPGYPYLGTHVGLQTHDTPFLAQNTRQRGVCSVEVSPPMTHPLPRLKRKTEGVFPLLTHHHQQHTPSLTLIPHPAHPLKYIKHA